MEVNVMREIAEFIIARGDILIFLIVTHGAIFLAGIVGKILIKIASEDDTREKERLYKELTIAHQRYIKALEEDSEKKKSYQDTMSIYDDQPVQHIERTPMQTGVSLHNLIDGELPDEIYKEGRR